MENASASSQSRSGSGCGSSQFPWTKEGGGLGGNKLMFDVDVNLVADDTVG